LAGADRVSTGSDAGPGDARFPVIPAEVSLTDTNTVGWVEPRWRWRGRRLLLCLAREDVMTDAGGRKIALPMAGCDLSILNSGRAPLLLNHYMQTDNVAGVIERGWIEDGRLYAEARLARVPSLAEVRRLVWGRVIRNCSMGYLMRRDSQAGEGDIYAIRWWRPYEVSLCGVPRGWLDALPCQPWP